MRLLWGSNCKGKKSCYGWSVTTGSTKFGQWMKFLNLLKCHWTWQWPWLKNFSVSQMESWSVWSAFVSGFKIKRSGSDLWRGGVVTFGLRLCCTILTLTFNHNTLDLPGVAQRYFGSSKVPPSSMALILDDSLGQSGAQPGPTPVTTIPIIRTPLIPDRWYLFICRLCF